MKDTIVYVLGAGCSANYGYPLATGFIPALETFSREFLTDVPDRQRLKQCVDQTVALMRHASVQTIDALIDRIHKQLLDDCRHSDLQASGIRLQRVRSVKIATVALFLWLERVAKSKPLDGYERLLLELFPGSDPLHQRLKRSNYRVLTFNYDRLFEMALLRLFKHDGTQLLYGESILNSGLNNGLGEGLGFATESFCFLKLHGSAGMRVREEYGEPRSYPYLDGRVPGEDIEINDDRFFGRLGNPPNDRDPEPLIIFPVEKYFVRSNPSNRLPFREYITGVWKQAEAIVASATELRFIGYSFHPMDFESANRLLESAKLCRRIVLQNRPDEAERIRDTLRNKHGITIQMDLHCHDF